VFYNQTVGKLQANPSDAKPQTGNPKQKTYDEMVLEDLLKAAEKVKSQKGKDAEAEIGERLKAEIDDHVKIRQKKNEQCQQELEKEENEQKKHITSDDLKEGFASKVRTIYGIRIHNFLTFVFKNSMSHPNQNLPPSQEPRLKNPRPKPKQQNLKSSIPKPLLPLPHHMQLLPMPPKKTKMKNRSQP
jgi:hypothetical protein